MYSHQDVARTRLGSRAEMATQSLPGAAASRSPAKQKNHVLAAEHGYWEWHCRHFGHDRVAIFAAQGAAGKAPCGTERFRRMIGYSAASTQSGGGRFDRRRPAHMLLLQGPHVRHHVIERLA